MVDRAFISYSHKDKFFAELLGEKLKDAGIEIWRDVGALQAGEEWRRSIDLGIDECFAMGLALSPSSCASHYVTYEWARGMGLNKPIIPVLLEECIRHPKIEPIQFIDFRQHNHATWAQLVQRLKETKDSEEPKQLRAHSLLPSEFELTPKEKTRVANIEGYLMERVFRMMSFDRVRDKIDKDATDEELNKLIAKVSYFANARLKGNKAGLRLR